MTTKIELVDWDIKGNVFVLMRFRRLPIIIGDASLSVPKNEDGSPAVAVDEQGRATRIVQPMGPIIEVTLHKDDLPVGAWDNMKKAYDAFVSEVTPLAVAHYESLAANPNTLDERINEAERAKQEIKRKQIELMALDAQIAEAKKKLLEAAPTEKPSA